MQNRRRQRRNQLRDTDHPGYGPPGYGPPGYGPPGYGPPGYGPGPASAPYVYQYATPPPAKNNRRPVLIVAGVITLVALLYVVSIAVFATSSSRSISSNFPAYDPNNSFSSGLTRSRPMIGNGSAYFFAGNELVARDLRTEIDLWRARSLCRSQLGRLGRDDSQHRHQPFGHPVWQRPARTGLVERPPTMGRHVVEQRH